MTNREIKFRGLSDNEDGTTEMVYGDLRHDKPNETLYYKTHPNRICWDNSNKPVRKGTEGQYIGHKDKNGNEIYEGDMYKVYENKEVYAWIVFDVFYSNFTMDDNIKNGEYNLGHFIFNHIKVGNIHENPELLK